MEPITMPHIDIQNPGSSRPERVAHTEPVMPANWPAACTEFARAYHGRSVRVLTLPTPAAARGDITDARQIAAGVMLDDIAAVAAMPLPNIDIRIREGEVHSTVQRVERPENVALEKAADGALLGLRIDDTDGVTTLVRSDDNPR
ncbi:MAG: hypothetical protein K9M02_18395 [Thiohalocapsa sp.]|nr:hypothetical protein [Thiohalocapsa sp.]